MPEPAPQQQQQPATLPALTPVFASASRTSPTEYGSMSPTVTSHHQDYAQQGTASPSSIPGPPTGKASHTGNDGMSPNAGLQQPQQPPQNHTSHGAASLPHAHVPLHAQAFHAENDNIPSTVGFRQSHQRNTLQVTLSAPPAQTSRAGNSSMSSAGGSRRRH
ncbi:hypothetical protein EDC04DRAFT_2890737 [Pisolithus marmoratus]|nr:hypothetical protein EDC04DRAFT_2890737 [Pisolithus marmoratus]